MVSGRRLIELAHSPAARRRVVLHRTRGLFFRLARHYTPAVAVDTADGRYFLPTRDRYIGFYSFLYGSFDAEAVESGLAAIGDLLGDAFAIRGRTIVDVGANIGTQTVPFLTAYEAARVIAIEPDAANAAFLRQNLVANGLQDRARVLELALTDVDGTVELERSPDNVGDHRVRPRDVGAGSMGEEARPVVSVRGARFDSLVHDRTIDLDAIALVWMDTQGHEGHVLAGASSLLTRPIPIVTEYWPYGLRRAGGLNTFHALVAEHYGRVVDLRSPSRAQPPRVIAATDVASLADLYPGDDDSRSTTTDLVLLP